MLKKLMLFACGWLAVVLVLTLLTGCGSGNNGATNTNGVKTQSYKADGYLGMTNTYPKIPGPHMASTYSNDANAMRQAIADLPGIKGTSITFNGSEAYVTIKVDSTLNQNEVPTLERQAASVLRFNFPRYTIHMKSSK
ncbi:MAG: hypothetical protein P0Y55_18550 [Candidatus Cohnella colombiensis]|uniref:Sporulation protein n=1 Tax=Candidatus Cohnella colombiensis TaxID=3121368 RepID=A0AA95JAL8_9BACL|nr:MAG: hypothetical protein P0Y55_18550 [Cohnella sp.]